MLVKEIVTKPQIKSLRKLLWLSKLSLETGGWIKPDGTILHPSKLWKGNEDSVFIPKMPYILRLIKNGYCIWHTHPEQHTHEPSDSDMRLPWGVIIHKETLWYYDCKGHTVIIPH